ncbi:hypothetical protein [Patulibacter minatonensis]|uniref:hypothetical protein n=1 Tax=Patulibacter minatonensis TaxID=298163 RepID=UPI00047AAF17|nr:hypothetical protein [Patulibacter minatonensis]
MATPPLVPGDVVRRSIELLRTQFVLLYPVALVFGLVQAMVSYALIDTGAAALALAVSIVLNTLMLGVVVAAVHDAETGTAPAEPTPGPLFRRIAPLADKLLLVLLITFIGTIGGLFLLIVPGLFLMTIWAVAAPVVVVERTGALAALTRSRDLVAPLWRPVLVTLLLMVLLLLPGAFVTLGALQLGEVGGSFVQVLFGAFVTVLGGIVATVLYLGLVAAEAGAAARRAEPVAQDADAWTGPVRPEARADDDPVSVWGGGSRTGGTSADAPASGDDGGRGDADGPGTGPADDRPTGGERPDAGSRSSDRDPA